MSSFANASCAIDESTIAPSECHLSTQSVAGGFKMLVCDPSAYLSLPIHVASQLLPEPMRIHAISRSEAINDARRFDLALFDISVGRSHALGVAGEICANDPTLECLFVTNDLASPAAAAAQSLGIRRIVTPDQSISWWSSTLQALAELTTARRALYEAEQRVPPLPPSQPPGIIRPVPLPEAERQFRLAYLSRLINEQRSHKLAASQAGVPYTTLCSMLKKLGLE